MKRALFALLTLFTAPAFALDTGANASAPKFSVTTTDGANYTNESVRGKTVVLEWFNPGCPFVRRVYRDQTMPNLQKEAKAKGVVWLTVNSTNSDHSDFVKKEEVSNALNQWQAEPSGYVIDAEGTLGKTFEAKTTPSIVVIDPTGKIAYQGAVDNYPEIDGDAAKLEIFVKEAIESIAAGQPVAKPRVKSYGCSIKYSSNAVASTNS